MPEAPLVAAELVAEAAAELVRETELAALPVVEAAPVVEAEPV